MFARAYGSFGSIGTGLGGTSCSSTSCRATSDDTLGTFKTLQAVLNRYSKRVGFTSLVVDGVLGPRTLDAAKRVANWVVTNVAGTGGQSMFNDIRGAKSIAILPPYAEQYANTLDGLANSLGLPTTTGASSSGGGGVTTPRGGASSSGGSSSGPATPPPITATATVLDTDGGGGGSGSKRGLLIGGLLLGGLILLVSGHKKSAQG